MIKIRISSQYDSSENLTERLLKQFLTENIDISNVEFVYDESYDVIVFFNYINIPIKKNSKVLVFPHEPSWNGSHQKHFDKNITVFGLDSSLYNVDIIESIACTFYGGRGPWIDKLDFWCYDNLKNFTIKKTKNIFSSITNLNSDYGGTCLYPHRYRIYEMVKKLEFVDTFDKLLIQERKDSLVNYKFNLVIENEYQNNWITEKFYDSILTETIPIYYGCKNIQKIYPENGYIMLENIDDLDYITNTLTNINNNSEIIYNEKIKGLQDIRKKYFLKKNLLKKIIDNIE